MICILLIGSISCTWVILSILANERVTLTIQKELAARLAEAAKAEADAQVITVS